ncbi:HDOD domain-containing protein [Desulfovibrio inopinatus]|uniref:HDOD domain-containing protein n=1 Tax=Desulfovibrio inopinatus TaxID=102109 RepID=UPI000407300A|nr:HDOD domain-containing protein [Desulfovibrio inopinatus]
MEKSDKLGNPCPPGDESSNCPIDPGVVEAAKKYTLRRFIFVDVRHDAVIEAFRQSATRVARRMTRLGTTELGGPADANLHELPCDDDGREIDPAQILKNDIRLASLPEVYMRINAVINDEKSNPADVAAVIGTDPSLSATLLRLANSPFYSRAMRAVRQRFPSKVDTLTRAVAMIGYNQLSTLALGISVLPLFQDIPPGLVDMKSFWKHSTACGVISKLIAEQLKLANVESYFVAGLLHDIGRLVMYKNLPGPTGKTLHSALSTKTPLVIAERERFGWDHAVLGGMLLTKWQYPASLSAMAGHHHDLDTEEYFLEASIIHVADFLTNALEMGTSGERFTPPLDPKAWERLAMTVGDLTAITKAADTGVDEIFEMFFPGEIDD